MKRKQIVCGPPSLQKFNSSEKLFRTFGLKYQTQTNVILCDI